MSGLRQTHLALALVFASPLALGSQSPAAPGEMVAIDDHRLFLACSGAEGNGPTVIFESGAGGSSADWSLVRDALGLSLRSCAYDRAGLGRSDSGPPPRTMHQEVFELRALLTAAKVKPPYVLVGQSIGGLLARLYTDAYPADVVGIVLVDPAHENAVLGSLRYGGWVRLREKATGRVIPPPRVSSVGAPPADQDIDYMAEEFQQIFLARQRVPQPLGQRPLVVLAAGKRTAPPPGTSAEMWKTLRDERDEQVRDLASLSANSSFARDTASGHNMHRDNPALVAQAIRDVLSAAMSGAAVRTTSFLPSATPERAPRVSCCRAAPRERT